MRFTDGIHERSWVDFKLPAYPEWISFSDEPWCIAEPISLHGIIDEDQSIAQNLPVLSGKLVQFKKTGRRHPFWERSWIPLQLEVPLLIYILSLAVSLVVCSAQLSAQLSVGYVEAQSFWGSSLCPSWSGEVARPRLRSHFRLVHWSLSHVVIEAFQPYECFWLIIWESWVPCSLK